MALRSWLGKQRSAAVGEPSAVPSQRSPKRKQSSCKGCGAGGSAENEADDKRLRRQDGPASLGSPKAENRFNVMLEKVKAYKLRHGHCRVPRDYAEDRVLGRWVSNIRSGNTKTVSPWGKRKGGAAASTDAALEGGAGRNLLGVRPVSEELRKLRSNQRNAPSVDDRGAKHVAAGAVKMSDEDVARLNELGFCWHVKNSYRHAEKSKLYDMDDAEQLLHPDTLSAIAVRPHALCAREESA